MRNTKFKKLVILACVLVLQPMLSPDSFALAKRKKSPPRAYSFWAEGGKASQEECDGERKVPRKLKHIKEFAKAGYMGSEAQTFAIKDKDEKEMFKHFFNSKSACNAVLAKTPSYAKKPIFGGKQELPPDEGGETDEDDKSDSAQEAPQDGPKIAPPKETETPKVEPKEDVPEGPSPAPSPSPSPEKE